VNELDRRDVLALGRYGGWSVAARETRLRRPALLAADELIQN